ncbi:TPA: LacI family DNA-binding transcriptional regulator [Clostridioides difficile]|nr:LacI family DNA-binding transcriptional regulator [Clostridioides difficile]
MNQKKVHYNKSATSKDVARLAGVSQSSVSRAFGSANGKGVKPEVREKIFRVANEIGYVPNLVARGMISGKTNVIGLIVGDSLGPFYNRIINLFVEKIQEIGKQCLVFKVPRQERIDSIISKVIQFQVEAVIITASAMNKVMAETCEENNIPVILFNRFIPGIKISTVYVDPIEGGGMAAEYLLKKGHKNIGYIQFTRETSEEMEKKIGFYSKLRQSGIHNLKEESANYDYDSGYEAGKRMLALSSPPTAIFCTSDLIAIGVMDAARFEYKLRVPEDLSVIGYDDIQMASWKSYNLTTIRQPLDLLIEKTINILKSLLNEENPESVVEMLKPELIERGSTL